MIASPGARRHRDIKLPHGREEPRRHRAVERDGHFAQCVHPQRIATPLAEFAELSEEIDVSRARKALERADASDPEGVAAAKRAQARLRAAGEAE